MALDELRLTIFTFPQRWDGARLMCNVLLLPTGDPFAPVLSTAPVAFVDARPTLTARVVTPVDLLPATSPPPGSVAVATASLTTPAPTRPAWKALAAQAKAQGVTVAPRASRPVAGIDIRKALPDSYLAAAGGRGGSPFTVTEDEYGCALIDQAPDDLGTPPPPTASWGELISHALRRPSLAAALGLLRTVQLDVDPADLVAGGWVHVALDLLDPADPGSGPPPPGPDGEVWAVRSYAARLPALTAARPLFAAVVFPVLSGTTPLTGVADATIEAETYDAGFASLVHTDQARTVDATSNTHGKLPPGTEAGVFVGWDDEQVAAWHNRQLDLMRARQARTAPSVDVGLGVLGYRVDARLEPAGGGGAAPPWSSLSLALQPPGPLDPAGPTLRTELFVEPVPVGPIGGPSWLPRYFAQWWGQSLVVDDPVVQALTPGIAAAPASGLVPVVPAVRPRYGDTFEFRARLVDLTGGGPAVTDEEPAGKGGQPVSRRRLLRHVPPKRVRIDYVGRPPSGTAPARPGRIDELTVRRPVLGYPEMVFAGATEADVADVVARAAAAAAAGGNVNSGEAIGIDDPAVDQLEVRVEVKAAPHDDETFHLAYTKVLGFPPPADPLSAPSAPLTVALNYVDVTSFADLHRTDVTVAGDRAEFPVPTGREVRLRLAAVCSDPQGAFGDDAARTGLVADVRVRVEEGGSPWPLPPPADVLALADSGHALQAVLLHPSATLAPAAAAADAAARLAGRLDVGASGITLAGRPGERVIVAGTEHVRHATSGDGGRLTLGSAGELWGHWLVGLRFTVERDWTWDGLGDPAEPPSAAPVVTVLRRDDGGVESPVASFHLPAALSTDAAAVPHDDDERSRTHVVVIDAVPVTAPADPTKPPAPRPTGHTYRVVVPLRGGGSADLDLGTLELPVAVPPTQVPRMVSAGLAESPYRHPDDYSSSEARTRFLWIEVEEPVSDPLDVLFARVLAYAPDPLLVTDTFAVDDPASVERTDPPVPQEPIVVVAPGEANDHAGLDAMTPLIPAAGAGSVHYLLPLPAGIGPDALQLHGLWTYELRVGHGRDLWSTGPARFGRPLRVAGVQHPPPTLRVTATRTDRRRGLLASGIEVSAPYAMPVRLDGQRPRGAVFPTTRLGFLIYAQVAKADGSGGLNVLVARCWATPTEPGRDRPPPDDNRRSPGGAAGATAGPAAAAIERQPPWPRGECRFFGRETVDGLEALGLPADTPLSVLAVELLPPGDDTQDPLGAELATQRILRTSPLVPIAPFC